ncbi:hypothetical protein MMC19_003090 [Ptychographa xylographoides]|nr:hypothetical protein [Ptychographa xylographoides]
MAEQTAHSPSTSPPSKRHARRPSSTGISPPTILQQHPATTEIQMEHVEPQAPTSPSPAPSPTSRKRKQLDRIDTTEVSATAPHSGYGDPGGTGESAGAADPGESSSSPTVAKKSRTNTPWTPAEERRLKSMRDAGNSWSEIAKTFPTRTEGSVKKHWYKACRPKASHAPVTFLTPLQDMHYADFAEDESAALLAAIKEYEASKWKVIGQKVGKPAKVRFSRQVDGKKRTSDLRIIQACEQYAKEHFGGRI